MTYISQFDQKSRTVLNRNKYCYSFTSWVLAASVVFGCVFCGAEPTAFFSFFVISFLSGDFSGVSVSSLFGDVLLQDINVYSKYILIQIYYYRVGTEDINVYSQYINLDLFIELELTLKIDIVQNIDQH